MLQEPSMEAAGRRLQGLRTFGKSYCPGSQKLRKVNQRVAVATLHPAMNLMGTEEGLCQWVCVCVCFFYSYSSWGKEKKQQRILGYP